MRAEAVPEAVEDGRNRNGGGSTRGPDPYLRLVGNGRMVVIVVIVVPHSSIPY